MAWGIDDDVLPVTPGEKGPGGVDGDALLLFLQERIKQKGIFELFALLLADGLNFFDFADRQGAGIGVQAAEQRRLSMVDMPHDHDIHAFFDGSLSRHLYIYPSLRNCSMPRPAS